MILILIALHLAAVSAKFTTSTWETSCKACSLDSTACRMTSLADRQMAEIKLNSVPESTDWLDYCDGVDVLHIDFNWDVVNSVRLADTFKVDTLIFSEVSAVLPGALSRIKRSHANSILFCDIRELGKEFPDSGRIGFVGALDESLANLFPRTPAKEGSMIIKFEPSFYGLIDHLNPQKTSALDSLLLEVTSTDQFLLLTEDITKCGKAPIINAIINVDHEDDMLTTTEFIQRLALLASAIEIRDVEMKSFTVQTMPRRLIVNLIRFMFVTYHHIRDMPGASDLTIFLQADYHLKTALSKNSAVTSKPYKDGFRCEISIEKLFMQYEPEMTTRVLQRQTSFAGSFRSGSGSSASANSVKSWEPVRPTRTDPSLNHPLRRLNQGSGLTPSVPAVPSASRTAKTLDGQTRRQVQHAVVLDRHRFTGSKNETIENPKPEYDEGQYIGTAKETSDCKLGADDICESNNGASCDLLEHQAADSSKLDFECHTDNGNDQAVPLARLSHTEEPEAVLNDSKSKNTTLDSPIVVIAIIIGSVVLLTIAVAAIYISSKRRRLKRSVKLQTPTTSKNDTDPETLWW